MPRGPRTSASGTRIGGGPSSGSAAAWSPLSIAGALQMDPRRVDLLTLSSGKVSALADTRPGSGVTWVQATAGKRLTYNASGTGGRPCFASSSSAVTELICPTGGAPGVVPYSISALVEITGGTGNVGSIVGYGAQNQCSVVGNWTTLYWGGGTSRANPQFGTVDSALHLLTASSDGAITSLYLDGQFIGAGNPSAPNNAAGSGIFLWSNGQKVFDGNFYQAVLTPSNIGRGGPGTNAWYLDRYMVQANPSVARPVYVACVGDSWTKPASGLTTPQMYPSVLQDDLRAVPYSIATASVGNFGLAGDTSTQILAAALTATAPYWSPIWAERVVSILCGTNDCGNVSSAGIIASTAATCLSNIAALVAQHVTAGYATKAIVMTIPARANVGWTADMESCRLLINTGIRAMAGVTLVDLAAQSEFSDANDPIWYMADKIHPTVAGAALVASFVAAAV